VRVVERARIVLFAASGQQDEEIAAVMAITPNKVFRWRKRFLPLGVAGSQQDAHCPGPVSWNRKGSPTRPWRMGF
jgi:hypothetical protein